MYELSLVINSLAGIFSFFGIRAKTGNKVSGGRGIQTLYLKVIYASICTCLHKCSLPPLDILLTLVLTALYLTAKEKKLLFCFYF